MTVGAMAELAVAVVLVAGSVVLYRRRAPNDGSYGSQGAVLLLVISAIMGAHGLGAFDYHPSKGELEMMKERGQ